VRAPYMVNNIRDLQALNERRAAEGQPPVPVPSEWQRLAALVTPPQAAPSPQFAPSPNPPPQTIPGLFPLANAPSAPPDAATATSLPIAQTPDSSYPSPSTSPDAPSGDAPTADPPAGENGEDTPGIPGISDNLYAAASQNPQSQSDLQGRSNAAKPPNIHVDPAVKGLTPELAQKHYEDLIDSRMQIYQDNKVFLDKNPFQTWGKSPTAVTLDNPSKKLDPKAETLWRRVFFDDGTTKEGQPTRNLGECASIATNLTGLPAKSADWQMGPSVMNPNTNIAPGTAIATFDEKTGQYSLNTAAHDGHTAIFISKTKDTMWVLEQWNQGHESGGPPWGGMPHIRSIPMASKPEPGQRRDWSNVANYFHVIETKK